MSVYVAAQHRRLRLFENRQSAHMQMVIVNEPSRTLF